MHDKSTILDYLTKTNPPEQCRFQFRISGSGKNKFEACLVQYSKEKMDNNIISFGDSLSSIDWVRLMMDYEVGMVFQQLGAENVVFPSKVFSILVAGQAVLAIASKESELGQLVNNNDCGWVVSPGDLEGLHKALHEACQPELLYKKRCNAFNLGHRDYDVSSIAVQWQEVFRDNIS
jgi:hypothetical protein